MTQGGTARRPVGDTKNATGTASASWHRQRASSSIRAGRQRSLQRSLDDRRRQRVQRGGLQADTQRRAASNTQLEGIAERTGWHYLVH